MVQIEALIGLGGPLPLELVNTACNTPQGRVDFLATPQDLQRWLNGAADRFPVLGSLDVSALTRYEMAVIHAVREHSAVALQTARSEDVPPVSAINGLNNALQAAPVTRELTWHDGTLAMVERRPGGPHAWLAAELADATADLLTSPDVTRIRKCAAHWCTVLFLPTHSRRRWCSPAICGNRTRVARHHGRRRDDDGIR